MHSETFLDLRHFLCVVCAAMCVDCADLNHVVTLTPTPREAEASVDPWMINQNVCPPILCGSSLSTEIQGEPPQLAPQLAGVHLITRVRAPGSQMASPNRVSAPFPFFEGDIVLDEKQKSQISKPKKKKRRHKSRKSRKKSRGRRSIVKPLDKHWKFGLVPFKIDQSLDDKAREVIHRAHRHIERQTCIRFREKTKADRDYLMYINQPGCWSYVGKTGGMQAVSLGYGCGQLGTAVHETTHALGFWHEQSRSDRDTYVDIILDNVSPSGKSQFGKRSKSESFSSGYVYDYGSIMHYGAKYFSANAKDTIKVKGIGERIGVKIGQRKGLSSIDVAQLNDIYFCNAKDQVERVCGRGWEPYDGSCYRFVSDDTQTHTGARAACSRLGSRLAHITSSGRDKFIKRILRDQYPELSTWRTGGRKINGKFQWEDPLGKRHRPMKYKPWAAGHPKKYTTLVLNIISRTNKTFAWKGTWAGSDSKVDKFRYPYICERKDYKCNRGWVNWSNKCYLFDRKKKPFERAHRTCVSSSSHLLHIDTEDEDAFIKDYLISNYPQTDKWRTGATKKGDKFYWYDANNRNRKMKYLSWAPNQPGKHSNLILTRYDGNPKRFVWKGGSPGDTSTDGSSDHFYICEKDAEVNCFKSSRRKGRDYRGDVMYTEAGITCQKWSSQYPNNHDYLTGRQAADKREGLGDHNFCRNPYGKRSRPWCYVPLKKTKWQYCDISIC